MLSIDWGAGEYELFADFLLPAAEQVVRAAALRPGERVLDVGCGTGSVALTAAREGAVVSAVEPAGRLREVAQARARQDGLDVTVHDGSAAELPFPDATFDAVLSGFAVIFAPDARAAAAELLRVLAPGGRLVVSAWCPGGAVGDMSAAAMRLVLEATGAAPPPPAFRWDQRDELAGLLTGIRPGMRVTLEEHTLAFTASSPAHYLDISNRNPMAVAGLAVLERAGRTEQVRSELLAILEEGNEDPAAFRATSRYVVATAT